MDREMSAFKQRVPLLVFGSTEQTKQRQLRRLDGVTEIVSSVNHQRRLFDAVGRSSRCRIRAASCLAPCRLRGRHDDLATSEESGSTGESGHDGLADRGKFLAHRAGRGTPGGIFLETLDDERGPR
jgi:hypothetical protein